MASFCEWACDRFGRSATPAATISSLLKNNPKAPKFSVDPREIEAFLAKVPVSQSQLRTFRQMFTEYKKSK